MEPEGRVPVQALAGGFPVGVDGGLAAELASADIDVPGESCKTGRDGLEEVRGLTFTEVHPEALDETDPPFDDVS